MAALLQHLHAAAILAAANGAVAGAGLKQVEHVLRHLPPPGGVPLTKRLVVTHGVPHRVSKLLAGHRLGKTKIKAAGMALRFKRLTCKCNKAHKSQNQL